MKNRIIEICELGQPQSIIHRENQPITELIKTDSLIQEINQQLRLHVVVKSSNELINKLLHLGSTIEICNSIQTSKKAKELAHNLLDEYLEAINNLK